MESRLPNDKLQKALASIEGFLVRKKVTLKELQSLIGTLQFATSVVLPGRAFLRRLIDLTIGVHREVQKIVSDSTSTAYAITLPLSYATIALYVASLHEKGFSASTITSNLSAIAYFHNISGYNTHDPTKAFVVRKAVAGAARLMPQYDARLPITKPILQKLVHSLQYVYPMQYNQLLYKAIFSLAFYGLARVGELVMTAQDKSDNVLQVSDVNIVYQNSKPSSMQVCFRHFKHNSSQKAHTITLNTVVTSSICPVQAMLDYLPKRGAQSGCLFLDQNKKPIPRKHFDMVVRKCLKFCDLDSTYYKGHSFRIGGATLAVHQGMSDSQIRLLGRWKSDAFKKYIICRESGKYNIGFSSNGHLN
ncbi:uncharacterized protein LOC117332230 [Pecten maximus]|uniref:uncharacterized protein LOC117332230 n=1 Tax=Pecten maximus TaxID=6579 RepID=UPI00145913AF|nr:uncharacterized protein LOC117332230 [Pecten maximus]